VEETMATRSSTDLSLVVLGLLGWVAAGLFAVLPPLNTVTVQVVPPGVTGVTAVRTTNPAAAGASCGLGIGGGLCLLGAGLAARRNGD
jgi:hypothetical protein